MLFIIRLRLYVETEIDKAVPEEDLEKNDDLSVENISLEKVGDLKKEAQHLCSIGSNLCNFYMEEFSGERTIEVFNSSKGLNFTRFIIFIILTFENSCQKEKVDVVASTCFLNCSF